MCKANYTCDEYVWTQSLTNYSPTKKTIEIYRNVVDEDKFPAV